MTAREKFIARLKELGLYDDWRTGDKAGKIMDDGSIVVLVHYEWDPSDSYDEFHFPPFDEMWNNEDFRKECADSYLEHTDDKFVADLARWLEYGPGCHYDCPLWPVDAYFPGSGLETEVITFRDDPEVMNTTNGHSAELVARINALWDRQRDRFKPILCALYERDIDEITDADSFQLPEWKSTPQYIKGETSGDWSEYNQFALECMKSGWEGYANNYLQHIADDGDLEVILKFVRHEI